ncbi:MAG: fibronectin type III domain-containing protein [Candidatus Sumerlaeota bacterium]
MAQFPRTEPQTVILAQDMAAGLAANAAVYPAPPVAPADLQTAMAAYITARDAAVAAAAAAEQATAAKNEALQALTDDMKADLRYAETTVNYDDDQLKLIGWGGRKSKTSLEEPCQTRSLEAPREGEGWVFLDWKEPVDGGAVAAYKIQRRLRPDGPWSDAGMGIESEITLTNQERGKEWEYRVLAVNKAGEGLPSNTVMVVL